MYLNKDIYTELVKEDISIQRRWEGLRSVKEMPPHLKLSLLTVNVNF